MGRKSQKILAITTLNVTLAAALAIAAHTFLIATKHAIVTQIAKIPSAAQRGTAPMMWSVPVTKLSVTLAICTQSV